MGRHNTGYRIAASFITITAMAGSISACTDWTSNIWDSISIHTITVSLPDPPMQWQSAFDAIRYDIMWLDNRESLRTNKGLAPNRVVELHIEKGVPAPVVLIPHAYRKGERLPIRLPAAGAIYPYHTDSQGILHLYWKNGEGAKILLHASLLLHGLKHFNMPRLLDEIWKKTDAHPNWIDIDLVLSSLTQGYISTHNIKTRPLFDIDIDIVIKITTETAEAQDNADNADGTDSADNSEWLPLDHFAPPLYMLPLGSAASPRTAKIAYQIVTQLPSGIHSYFHAQHNLLLTIHVGETGLILSRIESL